MFVFIFYNTILSFRRVAFGPQNGRKRSEAFRAVRRRRRSAAHPGVRVLQEHGGRQLKGRQKIVGRLHIPAKRYGRTGVRPTDASQTHFRCVEFSKIYFLKHAYYN